MPHPFLALRPVKKFIAIATEFNVLNCVALFALAERGDSVAVLADPHAKRLEYAARLHRVLSGRGLRPRVIDLADWSLDSIHGTARLCLPANAGATEIDEIVMLAIGGRKHDFMVLQDVVRLAAQSRGVRTRTVSVARGPASLRSSGVDGGVAFYETTDLADLRPEKAVTLDEVLQAHGFRRCSKGTIGTKADFDRTLPDSPARGGPSENMAGPDFERRLLRIAQRSMVPPLRLLVSEVWFNVAIEPANSVAQISTELDVLLLLRDGSAMHFECKTGRSGSAKNLQSKLFQLRRAFTPRSAMVLCKQSAARTPQACEAIIADLRRQYDQLGQFDVLVCMADRPDNEPLTCTIPSPIDQFRAIAFALAKHDSTT